MPPSTQRHRAPGQLKFELQPIALDAQSPLGPFDLVVGTVTTRRATGRPATQPVGLYAQRSHR